MVTGCGGDGEAGNRDPNCDVGAQRKVPLPLNEQEVLLACGEASDGRRIEIWSFSDAAGPCLQIMGLPRGPRQCGRPPSERIPPGSDAIAQITPESRLELYGATRREVRRVDVRFRHPSGCPGHRAAAVIRIEDRAALRAAHISEPFGYFIAFVPRGAREVVATGRSAGGAVVRRVEFDPIVDSLHPHSFIAAELRSTSR